MTKYARNVSLPRIWAKPVWNHGNALVLALLWFLVLVRMLNKAFRYR